MKVTSQTSISLIVKYPSSLLVSMFLPPSKPIQKPGRFAYEQQFLSPLNGAGNAHNSAILAFPKEGPTSVLHLIPPFPVFGKWREEERLNKKESLSK